MRADGRAFLVLAAAAGICAALAGCANGLSPQEPAASTLAMRQAASQRQGHVVPGPRASAARTAAGNDTPVASVPPPTVAPSPASHPPASSRAVPATLTSGLYTDAPDGTAHYVLSFTATAGSEVKGSVSYLYPDGRITTVGSYAGRLSGTPSSHGKITLTLGDGKVLSGSYTASRLNLASCAAVLPLATAADGCAFTYHGHVP